MSSRESCQWDDISVTAVTVGVTATSRVLDGLLLFMGSTVVLLLFTGPSVVLLLLLTL